VTDGPGNSAAVMNGKYFFDDEMQPTSGHQRRDTVSDVHCNNPSVNNPQVLEIADFMYGTLSQ